MIVQNNSITNSAAHFSPVGRQTVGQENQELKAQVLPPVEESAKSAGTLNRRNPDDRAIQREEQLRLKSNASQSVTTGSDKEFREKQIPGEAQRDEPDAAPESFQQGSDTSAQESEGLSEEELRILAQLAVRDRQVRNHERAHQSAGGQYAGAASFTYKRGPDGVSYAVGGEVSISAGAVPDNPSATISKAQQIQRAALAPADPSAQDRQVAARAAQIELQARSEVLQQRIREETLKQELAKGEKEEKEKTEKLREAEAQNNVEQSEFNSRQTDESSKRNFDINQRLLDIGVTDSASSLGSLLDRVV